MPILRRKRANPVTIGKWFIIIRSITKEKITTFEKFVKTYPKLKHLSLHERFLVYILLHSQQKWKVFLEKNREGEFTGVYCESRNLPEYLSGYEETSDTEVRNILIKIATRDKKTRAQLIKAGFQMPNSESVSKPVQLPVHLSHWEERLENVEEKKLSLIEFESKFPEVSELPEKEKLLLYAYYHGEQDWQVTIRSEDGKRHVKDLKFKAHRSTKRKQVSNIDFESFDNIEELSDDQQLSLNELSVDCKRLAEILSIWALTEKKNFQSFNEFKKQYSNLEYTSEFERFVVYTLLYKNHKWKTLVEKNSSNEVRVRIVLRHQKLDSNIFSLRFDTSMLEWHSSKEEKSDIIDALQENGFSVPIGYYVTLGRLVESLPNHLSHLNEKLLQPSASVNTLEEFKETYPEITELNINQQILLYSYQQGFKEWELVLESDVSADNAIYSTVVKKRKRVESGNSSSTEGSTGYARKSFLNKADRYMKRNQKYIRKTSEQVTVSGIQSSSNSAAGNKARRNNRKVSYAGDIKDIRIDPSEIAHLLPLVEDEITTQESETIKTYHEFRRRISIKHKHITEKELYALYCYYYGKSIWKIVVESENNAALRDLSIVSTRMHDTELPHYDIEPQNIAYWIHRIESSGNYKSASSLTDFRNQFPEMINLSESEQYLLFCYFYGRSFWKVTVQPSTAGSSILSLKITPMRRVHTHEHEDSETYENMDDLLAGQSDDDGSILDRFVALPEVNFPPSETNDDDEIDDIEFVNFWDVVDNNKNSSLNRRESLQVAKVGEQVTPYQKRRHNGVNRNVDVKRNEVNMKSLINKADTFIKHNPSYTPTEERKFNQKEKYTSNQNEAHESRAKKTRVQTKTTTEHLEHDVTHVKHRKVKK